ncbi:MAG: CopG family transcriptional regulator [Terriglobales bacterium]
MTKTTVYLDPVIYNNLKALARQRHQSPAELIRTAVREYTQIHFERPWPKSIGIGNSGIPDLASRDEEYLAGMGEDGLEPR